MSRHLRYIPEPGTLVEVTCRIIHGRMLLKPCRELNEAIIGTLARAKRRYAVDVCAAVYLSNHCHLLLCVNDARQLARFMNYVNSKIAREVGRRTRWREKLWGRRYSAIVVSAEPAAQIARLRYLLSHGVKEHLVARCTDWPGVHAADSLLTSRALDGFWFDRTAEYRDRLQGKRCGTYAHAEPEPLRFDPLPCWAHLSASRYRASVRELIAAIEAEAANERSRRGIAPLGAEAIGRQKPQRRPETVKRSSAPAVHAATPTTYSVLVCAYRWFEVAYREASAKLRGGDRTARFPEGCFPPSLPFVGPLLMPAS